MKNHFNFIILLAFLFFGILLKIIYNLNTITYEIRKTISKNFGLIKLFFGKTIK
jgi:hypothetical protein